MNLCPARAHYGNKPLWWVCFDATTDMKAVEQALQKLDCAKEIQHIKIEALEDKDWTRAWMDDFHPMQFGRRLWICPSWREAPEPSAVNVMLDPGLAFGAGTHPTTALCLRWLDGLDLDGKTVIDFGCGSGILAIAALKLGAQKVIGIDIDPQAIEASIDNATRNQVAERLETYLPEQAPQGLQADVVVANILAGPLLELAPLIAQYVKSGGQLVLSGLLEEQALEVREHYSQWFDVDAPEIDQDWARLTAVRQ